MKKALAASLVLLALGAVFGGCERNDYQHPLHRSN
jgi:hypothetical protein